MKRIIILSILILTLTNVGSAQSVEQKIIGTWINTNGTTTWTFKADGSLTINEGELKGVHTYSIEKLLLVIFKQKDKTDFDFSIFLISPDGKTFVFLTGETNETNGTNALWFTRK